MLFSVTFGLLYAVMITLFSIGFWQTTQDSKIPEINSDDLPYVSVITAFRNEADNLPDFFASIKKQNYPADKVEFILINDHSTDQGIEMVSNFIKNQNNVQLFHLPENLHGKKQALQYGIARAKHPNIMFTDADVTFESSLLKKTMTAFETKNCKLLLLPVFFSGKSVWQRLQAAEFMSLTASAAGSAGLGMPILSNGAGMVFKRQGNCDLNENYASGDDMFLLHSIKKQMPQAVSFIADYEAGIHTKASCNLNQFWQQRTRWVSKFKGYTDIETTATGVIVFAMNLSLILTAVVALVEPIFFQINLSLFLLKIIPDSILVLQAFIRFKKTKLFFWYLLWIPVYPFYVILSVSGGLIGREIHWKNRAYRRYKS